jgi:hypothetical protein
MTGCSGCSGGAVSSGVAAGDPLPSDALAAARISATDIFFLSAIEDLVLRAPLHPAAKRALDQLEIAVSSAAERVRDFFHELLL